MLNRCFPMQQYVTSRARQQSLSKTLKIDLFGQQRTPFAASILTYLVTYLNVSVYACPFKDGATSLSCFWRIHMEDRVINNVDRGEDENDGRENGEPKSRAWKTRFENGRPSGKTWQCRTKLYENIRLNERGWNWRSKCAADRLAPHAFNNCLFNLKSLSPSVTKIWRAIQNVDNVVVWDS